MCGANKIFTYLFYLQVYKGVGRMLQIGLSTGTTSYSRVRIRTFHTPRYEFIFLEYKFIFTCMNLYLPTFKLLYCKFVLFNSLTAAIRGSGYKLFVKWCRYSGGPARTLPGKWRRYPAVRLERYLQNGTVIRMAGFTNRLCLKIE